MKLNVNHFKKVHRDEHKTTLRHEDGHELMLAHEHLSPKTRGEIEAMPMDASSKSMGVPEPQKLADGGITLTSADLDPNQQIQATGPRAEFKQMIDSSTQPQTPSMPQVDPNSGGSGADLLQQFQQMQNQPQPQVQQQNPDPFGTSAFEQSYKKGIGEEKTGIEQAAQGEVGQAHAESQALQQGVQQIQNLGNLFNQAHSQLSNERQSLMDDATSGHIDPNQFWEDKSTPAKIGTAIGLILGGMGGGIMHQENPALKLLNAQIDRNINAQKLNVENKFNLLNANRAQFQNEKDATDMTRLMLTDNISNQLKLAAAKSMDPVIKARALQAAGQLDLQTAPVMSQIAMRQAVLGGAKTGSVDPSMAIRVIVPEQQQQQAYKELQTAQSMSKTRDNLLSAFDQVNKINTLGNRVTSPIQSSRQTASLRDPLLAQLVKDSEGRITPQDTEMIKPLFPSPGDNSQTVNMKRNQLGKFVNEKMNFPMLNGYGIQPVSGRFNQQGQSKFKLGPIK